MFSLPEYIFRSFIKLPLHNYFVSFCGVFPLRYHVHRPADDALYSVPVLGHENHFNQFANWSAAWLQETKGWLGRGRISMEELRRCTRKMSAVRPALKKCFRKMEAVSYDSLCGGGTRAARRIKRDDALVLPGSRVRVQWCRYIVRTDRAATLLHSTFSTNTS